MSALDRDPFAYAGRQENQDAEILALFHEWLDVCRTLDKTRDHEANSGSEEEERWNAACDRQCDIENAIFECRGGAIGLAIKTLLDAFRETSNWAPSASQVLIDGDEDRAEEMASLLRDAAALVPEIAECAVAVVHEDAPLIAADIDLTWVDEVWIGRPMSEWSDLAISKQRKALDRIANTAAKTPRGEAIKMRWANATVPA
jgi:hypothetical protein